jgi:DNA-binding response OmpR family regulator
VRILLVEDDPAVSHFVAKGLREHGWEVTVCGDGSEALSLALDEPFGLIVLDLLLPGLHGLEVLRRMREERLDTPVVILTALDSLVRPRPISSLARWSYPPEGVPQGSLLFLPPRL